MEKNSLNVFQKNLAICISVLIVLFYFFFNFNYLSNWVDEKGDAVTYEHYVKLGIPQFLYNPHHIAFDWLGEQFYHILKTGGYNGAIMPVLQLRNLIISSLGLGILFYLFYRYSKKAILSLLIVLPIGFTAAFWIYSQINDTPIIHSVLLALLFFAAIFFPKVKKKHLYCVFLGLFHAITVFFHQSDIIFIITISSIILFSEYFNSLKNSDLSFLKENSIKLSSFDFLKINNLNFLLTYLITLATVVTCAYFYVGVVLIGLTLDPSKAETFNKIKGSSYFFNWLILYSKIDYWGKGYESNLFSKIITGVSTYFFEVKKINNNTVRLNFSSFFSNISILPNFITVLLSFVTLFQLFFFKKMLKQYGMIYIANILFILTYFIFTCWWEPDYREFWVAPMFSFWILALFTFNFIIDKGKVFKPVLKSFIYSFMIVITILLFYYNFIYFIYPNASFDYKIFDIVKNIKKI